MTVLRGYNRPFASVELKRDELRGMDQPFLRYKACRLVWTPRARSVSRQPFLAGTPPSMARRVVLAGALVHLLGSTLALVVSRGHDPDREVQIDFHGRRAANARRPQLDAGAGARPNSMRERTPGGRGTTGGLGRFLQSAEMVLADETTPVLAAASDAAEVVPPPVCEFAPKATTLISWDLKEYMQGDKLENGKPGIRIVEDSMRWLKEIDGNVGVISIIGPYRSGKSWLLNQLLRVMIGKTGRDTSSFVSPFKVGHTVQAETEEVLAYMIPGCMNPIAKSPGGCGMAHHPRHHLFFPHGNCPFQPFPTLSNPSQSSPPHPRLRSRLRICSLVGSPVHSCTNVGVHVGTNLLVLDSPGLFAPNRHPLFDAQLLAVFNMLSSVVVYNTVNVVDRNSVEQLSFALDAAAVLSFQRSIPTPGARPSNWRPGGPSAEEIKMSEEIKSFKENEGVVELATPDNAETGEQILMRPHLVWSLQGFNLQMQAGGKTLDGTTCEQREHLTDQRIIAPDLAPYLLPHAPRLTLPPRNMRYVLKHAYLTGGENVRVRLIDVAFITSQKMV